MIKQQEVEKILLNCKHLCVALKDSPCSLERALARAEGCINGMYWFEDFPPRVSEIYNEIQHMNESL